MKKVIKLAVLPAVLFIHSGLTHAAAPGGYLGLGAGVANLQAQQDFSRENEREFAGRAFGGFNFNRYFGIEVNYSNFGKTRFQSDYFPALSVDVSLRALSLVGKIYLPLSDESPFNLYAFAGAAQMHGKYTFLSNSMAFAEESRSGTVATGGFGATYDINRHLTAGLEFSGYSDVEAGENNQYMGIPGSGMATLSIAYHF